VVLRNHILEGLWSIAAIKRGHTAEPIAQALTQTGCPRVKTDGCRESFSCGQKRLPAYPPELDDPCYVSVLGDWSRWRHAGSCRKITGKTRTDYSPKLLICSGKNRA